MWGPTGQGARRVTDSSAGAHRCHLRRCRTAASVLANPDLTSDVPPALVDYVFAEATERDARLLGVSSVVHWEWFESWREAVSTFLPRYAHEQGEVRGVFPINVPYLLEAFPWWDDGEFHRVVTGADGAALAVFRPRQWRGVHGTATGADEPFYLTPEQMAAELAGYPRGTVTWVYMTSDGGLSLQNSFMAMVSLLPDHVRLVSADAAARLAVEPAQQGGRSAARRRGAVGALTPAESLRAG